VAVSSQRPPAHRPNYGRLAPAPRRRRPVRYVAALLFVGIIVVAVAGALALRGARGSLSADSSALAHITLPMGGGQIANVAVVTGPHANVVPVALRGNVVWPTHTIPAGSQVTIGVTLRRPGWMSWLTGKTEHLSLTLRAPTARLAAQYVTLHGGAPLRVHFSAPVSVVAYGAPGHLSKLTLPAPASDVTVPHQGTAGSVWVAAAPRGWESARPTLVSWFPAGARASAVASPSPGTPLTPGTPIMLTFSKPVSQALGHTLPPVAPATPGTWHTLNSHSIVFRPEGVGYGLGAHVRIALPAGVTLANGTESAAGTLGSWRVPPGSTMRLQQLLANLGYLPLQFQSSGPSVPLTATAQEGAAVSPPAGHFSWLYGNVPSALRNQWSPGVSGVMTRGAVMAFESDHGLGADGDAGPLVWKSMISATLSDQRNATGYSFVDVSKSSQHLSLWHNGHTVLDTAVNTGIAAAPTQSGTFAVYEHLRVTTMSGTNPDGSHYHDPGIQFVSYFNGGDALHAFTRAQYGFPQSLGCVEMALAPAGAVWPYTPIGTLVSVS
jgi:peptidoglycan hydrolase-like protein with peptidoglycan-binding domain